jgi:3-isopropylmalate dehydrogenase
VALEDMLVDNAAMQLASAPEQFDVIVTENMFGDILSDLAAAVTGGLGLAPSASLADSGPGLFEPVHGSAPPLAGRNVANPIGAILSAALMLETLGRTDDARRIERAVEAAVQAGETTRDVGGTLGTREAGEAILRRLS